MLLVVGDAAGFVCSPMQSTHEESLVPCMRKHVGSAGLAAMAFTADYRLLLAEMWFGEFGGRTWHQKFPELKHHRHLISPHFTITSPSTA